VELKEKIKANGLKNDEIPHCIDLGLIVKGCGYSVHEINERFSTMKQLEDSLVALGNKMNQDGFRRDQLVLENSRLEETNSKHSLRLSQLVALDEMGFGFAELKQLRNITREIAEARNLPTEENAVIRWFIDNLRDHLYDYLDLGKTVQEFKSKIQELHTQRDLQLVALNLTPNAKKVVDSLVRIGIEKDNIEKIVKMVKQNRLSNSRPEVGKYSQLNEKRSAYKEEEVTSTQITVPAAKEQTRTERTDKGKEQISVAEDGGAQRWEYFLERHNRLIARRAEDMYRSR